jgi:hypothetical protein
MRLQFHIPLISVLLLNSTPATVHSFTPTQLQKPAFHNKNNNRIHNHHHHETTSSSSSSTSLNMVFDFFKKRAEEGVEQLSNLSTKAREGKLSEGLSDVASYTTETNTAFATGLAKSRNRLLYDLESAFNGGGDIL